ncbi:hypothetical protein [uncultured Chitinophaga sp.]|nr:hypothetical protein [uncultured Chitinophaga sp.]
MYDSAEPFYHISNTLGAGGLISTAADLQRWNEALSTNVLLDQA